MSRPKGSWNVGVRYVDGEWELRCNDCAKKSVARYWPLTLEFWLPKLGMSRCRACWLERRAARDRDRWANDPSFREGKRQRNIQHRRDMGHIIYKDRWERLKADPVAHEAERARRRGQWREAARRYRDRMRQERAA